MSEQIIAKKFLIIAIFILFSLIFVGGIFAATNTIAISAEQELSYPS